MPSLRVALLLRRGRAAGARPRRSRLNDMVIWRLLGDPIPGPQRLLESACSRGRLHREQLHRALRIGASFDVQISQHKIGSAAHAQYARHGRYPWDLHYLEKLGANLAIVDKSGNNVAHIAFAAANEPISRWLAAHRMELCLTANNAGQTPYDLLFGEIGLYNLDADENRAFRQKAWSWLGAEKIPDFKISAWRKALELLPSRCYRHDLSDHFDWVESFAEAAPDRSTLSPLLEALELDSDILGDIQKDFEPRYARSEREQIALCAACPTLMQSRGRL